jgi:putative flippase GtrA
MILPEQIRFLRFLVAGGLNTLFGYSAFAALVWAGVGNDAAVVGSTIAGVAFNYGTYGKVFAEQGFARLPAFVAIYGALLCANILALRFFVVAGVSAYVGQALVLILIVPVTYLALKRFVFAPAPEPQR